jgi:hypothetical protein
VSARRFALREQKTHREIAPVPQTARRDTAGTLEGRTVPLHCDGTVVRPRQAGTFQFHPSEDSVQPEPPAGSVCEQQTTDEGPGPLAWPSSLSSSRSMRHKLPPSSESFYSPPSYSTRCSIRRGSTIVNRPLPVGRICMIPCRTSRVIDLR